MDEDTLKLILAARSVVNSFAKPPGEVAQVFACFPELHRLAIILKKFEDVK